MKYFEKIINNESITHRLYCMCDDPQRGNATGGICEKCKCKNPAKAKLSLNTTYNGYDVTGDGKADTIRISSVSLEADEWNVGLKVEINGKKSSI